MKTQVEDISSVKKRLVVEIGADEVEKELNSAYRKLGKTSKIPGFRPGKIPRNILENYFGSQVKEDVSRELINATLPTAFGETKTFPIGPPVLEKDDIRSGEAFRYSAVMEVRPTFELPPYEGIEVQKEILEVTDADVEKQLDMVRQSNGKLEPAGDERPVQNDDYALVDYEAYDGDTLIENFGATDAMIKVGIHEFDPHVEEAMLGMRKGDEKDVTVRFRDDHPRVDMAGKDIRFKIRVKDIKTLVLPEMDDAFVEGLGAEFKTLDELRERIRAEIHTREEKRIDQDMKQRLIDAIAEQIDMELPSVLVESELENRVETLKQNLRRNGTDPAKVGLTDERLKTDLKPASEKRVKNMLILADIANEKSLEVSEEELDEHFKAMAGPTGQDPSILRKYYEARDLMGGLKQHLLEEKTLNYLSEHASILNVERSVLTGNQGK